VANLPSQAHECATSVADRRRQGKDSRTNSDVGKSYMDMTVSLQVGAPFRGTSARATQVGRTTPLAISHRPRNEEMVKSDGYSFDIALVRWLR
jgi:hypothetical protein